MIISFCHNRMTMSDRWIDRIARAITVKTTKSDVKRCEFRSEI